MFFVGVESVLAQGSTITGSITDSQGVPLPGINILEKGTANGGQTDFDGKFTIQVSGTDCNPRNSHRRSENAYVGYGNRYTAA